jgi:hypothetical protein
MTPEEREARARWRRWYNAHKTDEEFRRKRAAYNKKGKEKALTPEQQARRREYYRKYHEANKEKIRNYNRKYYTEKVKAKRMAKVEQLSMLPDVPSVEIEPKEHGITVNEAARLLRQVRKEEKLNHKPTPHVCRFYKPAYRCICGKRQEQAVTA